MKLLKIFLILFVVVSISMRKVRKLRSSVDEKGTDDCKTYCEKLRDELIDLSKLKLDKKEEIFIEGKRGEELKCYGNVNGKKQIFFPYPEKKVNIKISSGGKCAHEFIHNK